jgi:hypothetical protein
LVAGALAAEGAALAIAEGTALGVALAAGVDAVVEGSGAGNGAALATAGSTGAAAESEASGACCSFDGSGVREHCVRTSANPPQITARIPPRSRIFASRASAAFEPHTNWLRSVKPSHRAFCSNAWAYLLHAVAA